MKPELKKLLVLNLPYLLFVYLFAKCGQAYRLASGADASAKLLHLTSGISAAFANPLPSLHPFDLCVGVAGAVAVRLIVYSKGKNAKKYRKGEEYGSARWGTAKDIAPYIDPKFENNILLTQTERLTMTGRPKDPKTARNKNVLVIGGSGSGKTRFYVKPNLMQCFPTSDYPTSFVVTDPKGTLVLEIGQMFQRAGYRVKILNTINFSKSMKYNPFVYIETVRNDPVFGDYGRLIFPVERSYYSGDTLEQLHLTYYNNIDPDETVDICNTLRQRVANGQTIFYDIYTEDEKAADPDKADTGLFYFKGNPGAKFSILSKSFG